ILARQYARETMVLLKNDGVLPLKKDTKAAFIGGFAKQPRYQGGGSSHVNAFKVTSAYETALDARLPVEYAEGFGVRDYEYDPVRCKQAVALAAHCDVAVVFAGLPESMDSEGADRKHLDLPPCQNTVIQAIAQAQPNTIVVLCNGAPVRMPWVSDVAAILESYLAGEAVGEAQVDLLYGDYSPCAKLAETFPLKLQDTPCYGNFPGGTATVEYRESIYVGYRYYDKAGKDVLFPFGHGLGYTQFEYSNLRLARKNFTPGDSLEVVVTIKNTGGADAAEIVQFYVQPLDGIGFRPKMELKGFEKIFLRAGEKRRVAVTLDARAFSYWHTGLNDWTCAPGTYDVLAAASSRDVRLRASVYVHNDKIAGPPYAGLALPSYESGLVHGAGDAEFEALLGHPLPPANYAAPRRLDLNANLEDAQQSKFGRVLTKIVRMAIPVAEKFLGEALGDAEMLIQSAFEMPMRSIAQWSGGFLDRPMAEALVSIFNEENYLRSICELIKGAGRAVKRVIGK
ncbi:MAG: glycoside hydrolase family 3 C-terminal domain-containing protein, partial [Oscillospiraceae bacterium]|nr:glycoside hydrolase family 3 C-terminal domain-containing protein [Oscillospiraceae bacterium]